MDSNINTKLMMIQSELKAPKGQHNSFGNYDYRSLEDILTAVKPLLLKYKCTLLESDKIEAIGEYNYVTATATLADTEAIGTISVTASAKEAESQKGMSPAQVTGSTSSYARKYACNGLFAIDDTKDADATNKHDKEVKTTVEVKEKVVSKTSSVDDWI